MTRVSSNAGKHPYLRSDIGDLFSDIMNQERGIPMDFNVIPKFKNDVDTEYIDKNGKKIYFKNFVKYRRGTYLIKYSSKTFQWIMEDVKNNEKWFVLREKACSCEIIKKTN